MIDKRLKEELENVRIAFPQTFITLDGELILEPKHNIWILLGNVNDVRQIKLKMLAWLSYYCCNSLENKQQEKLLTQMNKYLNHDFTKQEMSLIYQGLKAIRNNKFESRHYLFGFGGYDFKYLDL